MAAETLDVYSQPAYSISEAARYLRLPPATLRSWVLGRDYPNRDATSRFHPLIWLARKQPPLLSFHSSSVAPPRDIVTPNIIGLSFSGGGLRAAAFAHGVLLHLQDGASGDVLDDVSFISSVSGGSLTAAWYGLHGRAGLRPFEDDVLLRDYEARMRMDPWAVENILRALSGGVNDRSNLAAVLDREVFAGATFADLYRRGRPDIWINATDLFNRTPFQFIPPLFATVCSDLAQLPVAEAVHASMAVPLVFAPVVLKIHGERCTEAPGVQSAIAERAHLATCVRRRQCRAQLRQPGRDALREAGRRRRDRQRGPQQHPHRARRVRHALWAVHHARRGARAAHAVRDRGRRPRPRRPVVVAT